MFSDFESQEESRFLRTNLFPLGLINAFQLETEFSN